MKICFNGQIVEEKEAPIYISDMAVWYDWGVYETVKIIQNVIFFPDDHIRRLFKSAELIDLNIGFDKNEIKKWVVEYAENLNRKDSLLKICVYGDTHKNKQARVYIFSMGLTFYPDKYYRDGVCAILTAGERFMPQSKTMSTLQAFLARKKAKEQGVFEALKVDSGLNIREGAATNIFIIENKKLITPPDEIVLSGVTRDHVIEIAKKNSINVSKEQISKDRIFFADEVFITGTVTNIMPVVEIDRRPISHGSVGQMTKMFQEKYKMLQREYILSCKNNGK